MLYATVKCIIYIQKKNIRIPETVVKTFILPLSMKYLFETFVTKFLETVTTTYIVMSSTT